MNEASSKFVDQIATQRLINDKLKWVHHSPDIDLSGVNSSFNDFDELDISQNNVKESVKENIVEISFPSSIETKYSENNIVTGRSFYSPNPKGDIVFVHGLYEDNMEIYKFFISMLNDQGLNVHLMTLPFHYERTPKESRFSGEYFWSGDVYKSSLAFKQAVYDLARYYTYIRNKANRPVWISGFSMGGGVGLGLVTLISIDGLFTINPVCNITELVWNSALFSTVKRDLLDNGITFDYVKNMYNQYEPLSTSPFSIKLDKSKVILAKGIYDQINDPENYRLFREKWNLKYELTYKAGHLNILRVPKLASDIAEFYFKNLN